MTRPPHMTALCRTSKTISEEHVGLGEQEGVMWPPIIRDKALISCNPAAITTARFAPLLSRDTCCRRLQQRYYTFVVRKIGLTGESSYIC
ncbi:hypothetical protein J6590_044176 [Homalodisca vitripennis]|nr:hypothetical protein J6590_044176 [Homalodisca vitripennis]